jgi:hypothetical protein
MVTSVNSLPIEAAVSLALDKLGDDATKDLRAVVEKVDRNMQMKEQIRSAQRILGLYEDAVRSGNGAQADQYRNQLISLLGTPESQGGLGLTYQNSAEMQALSRLPGSWVNTGTDASPNWQQLSSLPQDQRDKLLSGQIKTFESMLDGRAQSYSDLSQKLNFELQQANDIKNRMDKAQSDLLSKDNTTKSGILQNLKG